MAITIDELKRNVFPGESGGDYNALFGYANRPGGQFSGVNLTDMTVDQALQFANPSGPYGQSVKGQIGRVATPMGAYQVVGTTLRGAKEGLGLTGNEVMTPQLQDAIGMWIYRNQGPQAWEAWGGGQGGGNVTRSSKGTTGMGLLDMPAQQPQTFGQRVGENFRSGELTDRLALAFNSLRMNPDQNLAAMVGQRQEMRGQEQATNRTAQWLSSIGRDDLAQAMLAGSLDPQSAAAIAMQPADPMAEINLQKAQLELQNLQNPQPEFRRATPEEASAYGAQGGQFGPDGRFYAVDVPQGMTIESDGAGGFRMVQGAGAGAAKPLTEGQSKDVVYATRAQGALQVLEPVAGELTSLGSQIAGADPTGIIRGRVQSPEYQIARNAGDEFLQAILRKDTGAAITAGEQALYGTTYLPQPGDGPEVLDAKRMARQRAVAAINAGMSPVQIIATEKALGSASAPAAGGVVTITSDAEYEALPSGTTFISPDGKTRRKP